ncbi:MAG: protein TolR [Deltaproteobacteria bacterium]|jgi:biopolymer transport protein TolR|nr:protein TolR [Deltaproteobacteria bacterium]
MGRDHRPLSEINVTPFVDVMLVLLIIFMVTAPMLQQGLDVDLPETTTQPLRMQDEPLILTVDKEGKYHLASIEVPFEDLGTKLTAIFEATPDKEIFLRADQAAPYGVVVKAMAVARASGARSLGIVTEPE